MIPALPGAVPEIPVSDVAAADPDGNRFRVFYDFATPERERAKIRP